MEIEAVRAKMTAQLDMARGSALTRAHGWVFEVDDLIVYVTLQHRRRPEHVYLLRVLFDDFPRRAPSYVFVDKKTKQLNDQAWPPNVKHGDNQLPGICTPGTREFHEKWHLNDAGYPWNPDVFTFLDTLQRIQSMMEHGIG
jgi:hypothetical protein